MPAGVEARTLHPIITSLRTGRRSAPTHPLVASPDTKLSRETKTITAAILCSYFTRTVALFISPSTWSSVSFSCPVVPSWWPGGASRMSCCPSPHAQRRRQEAFLLIYLLLPHNIIIVMSASSQDRVNQTCDQSRRTNGKRERDEKPLSPIACHCMTRAPAFQSHVHKLSSQ